MPSVPQSKKTMPSSTLPGSDKCGLLNTSTTVPVLISTDSNFLQHAAVCLTSLLANTPELRFHIVMVSRPTELLDEGKLRRTLEPFSNQSVQFRKFEPPSDVSLPLYTYTIDTWSRLWIGEFFPEDVQRVLYLDSDLVVLGTIAPLWQTGLAGALLGAVDIPGAVEALPLLGCGKNVLGIDPEEGYFNAGVLIIDLKQWRDTHALETVLAYVEAHPERLPNVDQDALNACFHARRKRLDYEWNVIRPFFREPCSLPLARDELEVIRREAKILHFNGSLKPWSYFSDHPRREEYYKYLHMTEWRDFVPPDKTVMNMVRKGIYGALPTRLKNLLKRITSQ